MRWTHLVTLMDAEAARQEQANNHPAAILLRQGAEEIRQARLHPGGLVTPRHREGDPAAPICSDDDGPAFVVHFAKPVDASTAQAIDVALTNTFALHDRLRQVRG